MGFGWRAVGVVDELWVFDDSIVVAFMGVIIGTVGIQKVLDNFHGLNDSLYHFQNVLQLSDV